MTCHPSQSRSSGVWACCLPGAKRDSDGYLWITGRIDDMLNVSGHLLSTADVESVLIEHPLVAETAVVAHPHSIKGECLYCFVTLKDVSFLSFAVDAVGYLGMSSPVCCSQKKLYIARSIEGPV